MVCEENIQNWKSIGDLQTDEVRAWAFGQKPNVEICSAFKYVVAKNYLFLLSRAGNDQRPRQQDVSVSGKHSTLQCVTATATAVAEGSCQIYGVWERGILMPVVQKYKRNVLASVRSERAKRQMKCE